MSSNFDSVDQSVADGCIQSPADALDYTPPGAPWQGPFTAQQEVYKTGSAHTWPPPNGPYLGIDLHMQVGQRHLTGGGTSLHRCVGYITVPDMVIATARVRFITGGVGGQSKPFGITIRKTENLAPLDANDFYFTDLGEIGYWANPYPSAIGQQTWVPINPGSITPGAVLSIGVKTNLDDIGYTPLSGESIWFDSTTELWLRLNWAW